MLELIKTAYTSIGRNEVGPIRQNAKAMQMLPKHDANLGDIIWSTR